MRIAVIGLGYVGLPVAVAFARAFPGVVGFDISKIRVEALRAGVDATGEITGEELKASTLKISDDEHDLAGVSFFVVTVPTPIDAHRRPDLSPLESACVHIARCSHGHSRWKLGEAHVGTQARNWAALLVYRHNQRRVAVGLRGFLRISDQLRQLGWRFNVRIENNNRPDVQIIQQRLHFGDDRRRAKANRHHLAHFLLQRHFAE